MENMTIHQILFCLTFLFGVLKVLGLQLGGRFSIVNISELIAGKEWKIESKEYYNHILDWIIDIIIKLFQYIGWLFFYFSLFYQIYYWFILILKMP